MPSPLDTSDIVALAFLAMEKTPPASFDDDSDEARFTTDFYPRALDRMLETTDWSFASTYVQLPPLTAPPGITADPALPGLYAVPGDCLRLREVGDPDTRWRLDRDVLRADTTAALPIRYTARIDDEARAPQSFRDAVALQLAIYLAPRFLGTQGKIETLKRDLADALAQAQREDSRTASGQRYDGLTNQGDWATEATR